MQNSTELLKKIALGYLFNYLKMGISTQITYSDITSIEISYFANVGECLGYRSIREKHRADLIWQNRLTERIEMYLERETENWKAQRETLPKLAESKHIENKSSELFMKIGVFAWIKPTEFDAFLAKQKQINLKNA